MKLPFLRKDPPTPSEEAVQARETAKELSQRADIIFYERRHLERRNHFAERIRIIYEGES